MLATLLFKGRRIGRSPLNSHRRLAETMCVASVALAIERSALSARSRCGSSSVLTDEDDTRTGRYQTNFTRYTVARRQDASKDEKNRRKLMLGRRDNFSRRDERSRDVKRRQDETKHETKNETRRDDSS